MKTKLDEITVLQSFEEAAYKHSQATKCGDYKSANACFLIIARCAGFLKDNSKTILLANLLGHQDEGVQTWAATYLLPVLEQQALHSLNEIARSAGIQSVDAAMAIKEWNAGRLMLQYK